MDAPSRQETYEKAEEHWKTVPATVDGMLGGFSHISSIDVQGSLTFLQNIISDYDVGTDQVLDCGAGIGRVSKNLLIPIFNRVDLVEQNQKFLDTAPKYLGESAVNKVGEYFCSSLQFFTPEKGRYDVIWVQWVLGHLTDDDLSGFLIRCIKGLKPGGVLCIKENMSREDLDFDEYDHSWTRSRQQFLTIYANTGLTILREKKQKRFPKDIYDVRMFALRAAT